MWICKYIDMYQYSLSKSESTILFPTTSCTCLVDRLLAMQVWMDNDELQKLHTSGTHLTTSFIIFPFQKKTHSNFASFPLKKKCQKKNQHQPTHHTHPSFGSSDLFIKVCFFRSDAADGQNATLRAIRPTDLGVVVLRSPVPDAHATLVVYQHFLTHLGRLVGWRMPNSTSDASDVANLNKNRV